MATIVGFEGKQNAFVEADKAKLAKDFVGRVKVTIKDRHTPPEKV
jgi:hypothetical protein